LSRLRLRECDLFISFFFLVSALFFFSDYLALKDEVDRFFSNEEEFWDEEEDELEDDGVKDKDTSWAQYLSPIPK